MREKNDLGVVGIDIAVSAIGFLVVDCVHPKNVETRLADRPSLCWRRS
jgi:hypothetical protein